MARRSSRRLQSCRGSWRARANRLEVVGCLLEDAVVDSVELNLDGAGFHAGLFQDVLQAGALPFGIAHGAVAPLHARDARLEEAAGIAGALIDAVISTAGSLRISSSESEKGLST